MYWGGFIEYFDVTSNQITIIVSTQKMFKLKICSFFSISSFSKTEGDGDKRFADSCSGRYTLQELPSGYCGNRKKFHFVGLRSLGRIQRQAESNKYRTLMLFKHI